MAIATPFTLGLSLVIVTTGILTWLYYRNQRQNRKSRSNLQVLLKDPNVKYELKLIERVHLSHNTRRFRFELPPGTCLGLQPGQHIYLSAVIDGSVVVRTYSPVSTNRDFGFMDLIIKVYFKGTHPKFPNGGKLSQYLNNLNLGESVFIRGPAGRMVYNAALGEFVIRDAKKSPPRILRANTINMIAGGSGITPILQVLHELFTGENESGAQSKSRVSLVFANQTEDDILCRSYLEEIAQRNPERLRIWYTLSQPPQDWSMGVGRVSREMFQDHLFPPSSNGIQLLCGPGPMISSTCLPTLEELGYESSRCFVY